MSIKIYDRMKIDDISSMFELNERLKTLREECVKKVFNSILFIHQGIEKKNSFKGLRTEGMVKDLSTLFQIIGTTG